MAYTAEDVADMRVVDLKKHLKKLGLSDKGRKAELSERCASPPRRACAV